MKNAVRFHVRNIEDFKGRTKVGYPYDSLRGTTCILWYQPMQRDDGSTGYVLCFQVIDEPPCCACKKKNCTSFYHTSPVVKVERNPDDMGCVVTTRNSIYILDEAKEENA